MGSHTRMVSRKNMTVINFVQSRTRSRVSIGFSCTVLELQNTSHSHHISPWEVVRAWFREKMRRSYTLHKVSHEVKFRSVFHAPSQKFKKLDEHDFAKK
ncbi:hypothetical protein GW17_00056347 [Ensete ventricosum]|nr:hypothetical protein GW17_00056347 [Ensete ventricosum]